MDYSELDGTSLVNQARALLSTHTDRISNAANLAALIYMNLEAVNWAGFYFLQDNELTLGPFQGKPACVSILLGEGVCGTAAVTKSVLRVPDVHAFEGHIACDVDSRSELVIPLIKESELIGVLDLDSPQTDRFSENDQDVMTELANIYVDSII